MLLRNRPNVLQFVGYGIYASTHSLKEIPRFHLPSGHDESKSSTFTVKSIRRIIKPIGFVLGPFIKQGKALHLLNELISRILWFGWGVILVV